MDAIQAANNIVFDKELREKYWEKIYDYMEKHDCNIETAIGTMSPAYKELIRDETDRV